MLKEGVIEANNQCLARPLQIHSWRLITRSLASSFSG
jgi:hypothetical protein